ncbi:MAG: hypothetical protein AAF092_07765 [Pseudomonadota bacterium]
MKHVAFVCLAALPTAALAEEEPDARSLMERGAELFFEGLRQEMEPAIEGLGEMTRDMAPAMREFMMQMGPQLRALLDDIEDLSQYEPPVMLPNGDILLRRKVPEEVVEDEGGVVDL